MVTLYRSLAQQTELDRQTTTNTMGKLFALVGLKILQAPVASRLEAEQAAMATARRTRCSFLETAALAA